MKTVNGQYTSAKIFTDQIEDYALAQIRMICDHPVSQDSTIRIMPDVHPGTVGVIGLTMTLKDRILPNLLGIDIGCGITLAKMRSKKLEYQKLDRVIRLQIPSGSAIRKNPHHTAADFDFTRLYCYRHIQEKKARLSLGSLGGGNHFIEIDQAADGSLYLAIHSGSRHLGKEVAEYYLNAGQKQLKEQGLEVPYPLTHLEGSLMANYLHDVGVVQQFAECNRQVMLWELVKGMKLKIEGSFSTVHNYLEPWQNGYLLRKGAVSAREGELLVIPVNMKDGVILAVGKGNPDWNCSAPHGSGRVLKREEVKHRYTVSQFKTEMKGIHCSCIGSDTLDEAPFAYRKLETIRNAIGETAAITEVLKPVYNFKAGKGGK